jgi:tetratricopeptide (TPR) repeat protein
VKLNWEWDFAGALNEFHRAIELNPSHEAAHRWLSAFLAGIGRDDEAMPIALRAIELDPISVLPRMNLGIVQYLAWRFEDAALELRRVLEKDPNFVRAYAFLSCCRSFQERHDEAIAIAQTGVEKSNNHAMLLLSLAVCVARSGKLDEARAIFEPIMSQFDPFYEATAHAMLKEDAEALDALERGRDVKADWMYSIGRQAWFRQYHDHPRFIRLLEELRLPAGS